MGNKCFEVEKWGGTGEATHPLGGRDMHRIAEKTKRKAGTARATVACVHAGGELPPALALHRHSDARSRIAGGQDDRIAHIAESEELIERFFYPL